MQEDVEAEMRRLKIELKQTMDMYSTACKEALSAKQKVQHFSFTFFASICGIPEETRVINGNLHQATKLLIQPFMKEHWPLTNEFLHCSFYLY